MRKKIISVLIFIILSLFISQVCMAKNDTFELQLTVKNNSENKSYDMYILLPTEYIEYAIKNDVSVRDYVTYEGPSTIKQYVIKGIGGNAENVLDETYTENGIEYVQIKLEENSKGIYVFDILNDYGKIDMKYRIKNEDKDYIMHIDNFKIDENICQAEYDYDEDVIKQPDTREISFSIVILIIILILIVFLAYISYMKTR